MALYGGAGRVFLVLQPTFAEKPLVPTARLLSTPDPCVATSSWIRGAVELACLTAVFPRFLQMYARLTQWTNGLLPTGIENILHKRTLTLSSIYFLSPIKKYRLDVAPRPTLTQEVMRCASMFRLNTMFDVPILGICVTGVVR